MFSLLLRVYHPYQNWILHCCCNSSWDRYRNRFRSEFWEPFIFVSNVWYKRLNSCCFYKKKMVFLFQAKLHISNEGNLEICQGFLVNLMIQWKDLIKRSTINLETTINTRIFRIDIIYNNAGGSVSWHTQNTNIILKYHRCVPAV